MYTDVAAASATSVCNHHGRVIDSSLRSCCRRALLPSTLLTAGSGILQGDRQGESLQRDSCFLI